MKWHREGKKIIKGVLMSRFLLGAPGAQSHRGVLETQCGLGLSQKQSYEDGLFTYQLLCLID